MRRITMVTSYLRWLYEDRTPPATMTDGSDGFVRIASSAPLIDKYRMDQMNAEHNVTDMHLACDDGHVPVHRYLLMGLSSFLQSILETEDPSELAVIHLCGTKVSHVVQLMTLVYYGKCVVQNGRDKDHVFRIMRALGISTKKMQYRKSNGTDKMLIPKLRYFQTATREDIEMETTFVDTESLDKALVHIGSPDVDDCTIHRNRTTRRRAKKVPGPTLSDDRRIQLVNSTGILECCCCQKQFQSHEELVKHVRVDCAKHIEAFFDYYNRQCLLCEKSFPEDFHIWAVLNHVVECQANSKNKNVSGLSAKTRATRGASTTQSGGVFINCDSELSESNSGAISPVSISSNSKDSSPQSFNGNQNQIQEEPVKTPAGISLSSNEIEIVEISDSEQMFQQISIEENIKELRNDNHDEELPPLVNLPATSSVAGGSSSSSSKPKQAPIVRKRRRRRPLVYNPHRNKRSRATVAAAQAVQPNIDIDTSNSQNQDQHNTDTQQVVEASHSSSPIHLIEIDDDDVVVEKFADESDMNDISTCCLIPGIDPHILRSKLGLSPSSPLTGLPADTIHTLLQQCPVCDNEFERLKDVTKCLRYHGYRYCYACLQVLPCQGQDFAQHCFNAHNISVNQVDLIINKEDFSAQSQNSHHQRMYKVPCPFCSKGYEFRSVLASHLGNYHCSRPSEELEVDEYSIENPRAAVKVVTTNLPQNIIHHEVDCNKSKVLTVSPGPSSSGSRTGSRSNTSNIVYPTVTATSNRKKSDNKSLPFASNKSAGQDEVIMIWDVKSLAAAATIHDEKKRPTDATQEESPQSQPETSTKGTEIAVATSSPCLDARKLSSSSKSPSDNMPSVIFMTDSSGDCQSNENEGIDRRSSLDTPSSMSLSDIIEDNVSSTGLSSASASPASSSNSRNVVPRSRNKQSLDSDSRRPTPGSSSSSASAPSSARSSPRRINSNNESNPINPNHSELQLSRTRGRVSKSSSSSSRGSISSNSSKKSNSSQRKSETDDNTTRLRAVLGTVKINHLNDFRQLTPPPTQTVTLHTVQYEDISPASSPSQSPLQAAASVDLPSSLGAPPTYVTSLPPPEKREWSSLVVKPPSRLAESDHQFDQQQSYHRFMFTKPAVSVSHHSDPGSRRYSSVSLDSLENQALSDNSATAANSKPQESVNLNEDQLPPAAAEASIAAEPALLKTKAYYKDRPIHIIKAGVAPESVIISGRSTPSMASDCESNFGSGGGGGPKSVGSFHIQSPPPPAAFDVASSPVANNTTETETTTDFAETGNGGASQDAPLAEDTADNISVSSSTGSATGSTLKSKRTFLCQQEQGGILYNVYCSRAYPNKTIRIPADQDPANYNPHSSLD